MPQGRNGKGNIYVWASGDGGPNDDCNCDGYAASMWTVSINSATNDGRTAGYDESCSSTLASTFSNGKSSSHDAGVVSAPPFTFIPTVRTRSWTRRSQLQFLLEPVTERHPFPPTYPAVFQKNWVVDVSTV